MINVKHVLAKNRSVILNVILSLCLLLILYFIFNKAYELLSTSQITLQLFCSYILHSLAGIIAFITALLAAKSKKVKIPIAIAIYLYVVALIAQLYSIA